MDGRLHGRLHGRVMPSHASADPNVDPNVDRVRRFNMINYDNRRELSRDSGGQGDVVLRASVSEGRTGAFWIDDRPVGERFYNLSGPADVGPRRLAVAVDDGRVGDVCDVYNIQVRREPD